MFALHTKALIRDKVKTLSNHVCIYFVNPILGIVTLAEKINFKDSTQLLQRSWLGRREKRVQTPELLKTST